MKEQQKISELKKIISSLKGLMLITTEDKEDRILIKATQSLSKALRFYKKTLYPHSK